MDLEDLSFVITVENFLSWSNCQIRHYVILPLHCHQVSNLELVFSTENNLNLVYFYSITCNGTILVSSQSNN